MSEHAPANEADPDDDLPQPPRFRLAFVLLALTCTSTTFVGWLSSGDDLHAALAYSGPLMAILLAHELGHYIAARIHRVPTSPPFFIPVPWPPLGTMGAVILMRDRIASRNALLDIGAAGPLAGMAVALPVLIYGIVHSEVTPLATDSWLQEGHSLLYVALLHWLKGPIAPGHDIQLSPTAFAGWAGLLVTMINLMPSLQLDGGHVAYALLGERYPRVSRFVRAVLLPLAVGVALWYTLPDLLAGRRDALWDDAAAGMPWLVWWLLLGFMGRRSEHEHPPTDPGPLSPARRAVAVLTLLLFVLLFMPSWLRTAHAG
jgi:membrane-associated protease RseP (regulator of RpoE activity)